MQGNKVEEDQMKMKMGQESQLQGKCKAMKRERNKEGNKNEHSDYYYFDVSNNVYSLDKLLATYLISCTL
jgi:hypothetical protein